MTGAVASLGYAVFLAVSILSFVGVFLTIMAARLATRLFVVHR